MRLQPVPRGAGGAAAVPDEPGRAGPDPRADLHRRAGAVVVGGAHLRRPDRAGREPAGPVPDGDGVVQPGAGGVAVQRGRSHHRRRSRNRLTGRCGDAVPGRGAGVPEFADQHAVADPGRGGHHVHRAGHPVRKLHPPHHDPVHLAVRRRGGLAGVVDQRHRAGHDRHHRDHPADRHREEERHHDDRLCAGCRAQAGADAARGHPRGRAAAFPPHPDDHAGRPVRRLAVDAVDRHGR
ncbi:hypothetical protein G6F57_018156 [Rhizopus arrhizus]|nr:hypothetical protein G6F57_018156 [Rhizopus arrhizus]